MIYPKYLLPLFFHVTRILERIEKMMKYKSLVNHRIFLIILVLLIGIWTIPWPLHMPSSGLDPSWVIGINIAASENMQFGPEIAFTFGPLGFLYIPTFIDQNLWFLSLLFTLFIHFLFIFSIVLLMVKSSSNWKDYIIVLPVLLVVLQVFHYLRDTELLFSIIIFLYLIATDKIDRNYEKWVLLFISLMLAIATLIKFNMALTSVSIILSFLLISFFNKRFKRHLFTFVLYIVFIIILWTINGQYLANLPVYLVNGFQLSFGYSDAMATNGMEWQVYLGSIGIIFLIILFAYSLVIKDKNLVIFIFLNSIFLFFTFKHGFVRHDGHVYEFFSTFAIFFSCIFLLGKSNTNFGLRCFSLLMSFLFIISICLGLPFILEENVFQKVPAFDSSFSLISDQTYQTQVLEDAKNKIRRDHPLENKTIHYLKNSTVDIFPWDIALVWAYNFNWSPRPVFQSYSAYTEYLDKTNVQHFSNEEAPQAILYSFKSIDERYPLFDEPSTFASILQNYSIVNKSSDEFLLLFYNSTKNSYILEEDLGVIEVELGQPITIPTYDSGYVFARIELEYSTFGKLMKFIYKPAPAFIRFGFSDLTYSNEFRFIPGVSKNGVFLSQYVNNIDDLANVFSGNITRDINKIIIDVDNPLYYNNKLKVMFFGVPAKIFPQNKSSSMPEWQLLKCMQGGIGSIDTVDKKNYYNGTDKVYIDKNISQFIDINGWAADDLTKDGGVKTFLVFSVDQKEIVIPNKKQPRPDVANYLGVKSYEQSGWSATIRSNEFNDTCYNVSLRILRLNDKEYYELVGGKPICFC